MPELVPVVLAAWVVLSVFLFWRLPGRDAAITVLIGGWAFLPVAAYPKAVFHLPVGSSGSMHALALPTSIQINKATAIAVGCLAGALLFDWPSLRRLRFSKLDLPIVVWCLTPLASAYANGLALADGLAQARYLGLTWGVPYAMGRAYLVDDESLRRFGLGWVFAGLAYAPLCLIEFVTGPVLYQAVYGDHPYRLSGADRPFGHRPMVFLEDGNQLGSWTATAAVAAVWLWRSGRLREVAGVRGSVVAAGLVGLCLACQSHGSIVLMAAFLVPVMLAGRLRIRPSAVVSLAAVAAVLLGALLVLSGGLDRGKVRSAFHGMNKSSFTWRLARYEENVGRATEHPILGLARPNWSASADETFLDPVALGLWLFTLGSFGLVGMTASTLVLTLPAGEVLKWLPLRAWLNPACSAVTLAAALLFMNTLDALLNSVFLLPLIAGAGGINTWSIRRY